MKHFIVVMHGKKWLVAEAVGDSYIVIAECPSGGRAASLIEALGLRARPSDTRP